MIILLPSLAGVGIVLSLVYDKLYLHQLREIIPPFVLHHDICFSLT